MKYACTHEELKKMLTSCVLLTSKEIAKIFGCSSVHGRHLIRKWLDEYAELHQDVILERGGYPPDLFMKKFGLTFEFLNELIQQKKSPVGASDLKIKKDTLEKI